MRRYLFANWVTIECIDMHLTVYNYAYMSYKINRMSYIVNRISLLFRKWTHCFSLKVCYLYILKVLCPKRHPIAEAILLFFPPIFFFFSYLFCSIFCSLSSYFSTHKRLFLVYLQHFEHT